MRRLACFRVNMPAKGPTQLNYVGNPARLLGDRRGAGEKIVGRYVKDIMRCGTFKHPQQGWEMKVDREKLDQFVDNFNRMKAAGVDVEFVVNHDLKEGAKRVHGYAESIYRDGDTLYARLSVRGAAGNDLVERVKNVSVEIMEPFTDGEGNEYDPAISAVALVEKPIITKQQPFKKVAAQVLSFAIDAGDGDENTTESGTMDLIKLIAQITGKTCSTAEEASAALKAWSQTVKSNNGADPKVVAASVLGAIDPDIVTTVTEGVNASLDGLVASGALTPDCRKNLGAVLLGTAEKPHTLALSTRAAESLGVAVPTAKAIVEALKGNKPKAVTGTPKTAAQTPPAEGDKDEKGEESDEDIEKATKQWAQRTGGVKAAAAATA